MCDVGFHICITVCYISDGASMELGTVPTTAYCLMLIGHDSLSKHIWQISYMVDLLRHPFVIQTDWLSLIIYLVVTYMAKSHER